MKSHFKVREVAEKLGVSERTVYDLMQRGVLLYRTFGRSRRIGEDQLQAFIEDSTCQKQSSYPGSKAETAHTILLETGVGETGASAQERPTMRLPFMHYQHS